MDIPYSCQPSGDLYIEVYGRDGKLIHHERVEDKSLDYVTIDRLNSYVEWYQMVNDDFDFIKFMGVTYDNQKDLTLDVIARFENNYGNYLMSHLDVSYWYSKYMADIHDIRLKTTFMFKPNNTPKSKPRG